jgi:hypothetical protein
VKVGFVQKVQANANKARLERMDDLALVATILSRANEIPVLVSLDDL